MTIKEFKEKTNYWLDLGASAGCVCVESKREINLIRKIINLIGEDVVIKSKNTAPSYVGSISLNGIINALNEGYDVINAKEFRG